MHFFLSIIGRVNKLPSQQARPRTVQLSSFDSGTPDFERALLGPFGKLDKRTDRQHRARHRPTTYGIEGGFARL